MPNRILKESICTSDSIDGLSWFEEVLFYRLIVNCDDFGRFDGRPAIIKNRLFPLKESLTSKAVSGAIEKLVSAGLVVLYMFENKPYLYLPTWNCHQTVRAKVSKYPDPEDGCKQMKSSASNCKQMQADVPVFVFDNRYSNSIFDNRESDICSEPSAGSEPPVAVLPLADKTEFPIYQTDIDKWSSLYPAVDILAEIRKMIGWCDGNPTKRKTKNGILKFINSWLAKEQDRGGSRGSQSKPSSGVDRLAEMYREEFGG